MLTDLGDLGVELVEPLVGHFPFQAENGGLEAGQGFTFDLLLATALCVCRDGFFGLSLSGFGHRRPALALIDLVLEDLELSDIVLEQGRDLISGDRLRGDYLFKVIVEGQKELDGVGMRVGSFEFQVLADLFQSLQVDLGHLVSLPHMLQVGDFIGEFLQNVIVDLPVQGKDNGLEPGQGGIILTGELKEIHFLRIKGLVSEQRQIFDFIHAAGRCVLGSFHVLLVAEFFGKLTIRGVFSVWTPR